MNAQQTYPRHPEVEVQLIGGDGNAFSVMGSVAGAMKRAGLSKDVVEDYMAEAMSGDYDHLLRTTMQWVTVR